MRVLFTSIAGVDHLFPLVPLAQAFAADGHDVLLISAGVSEADAIATGLHVVDAAPDYTPRAAIERVFREHPDFAATVWPNPVGPELTPWAPMFAAVNRPLIDRALRLAEDWRPDLVVHEQVATVGLIVATSLGVPAVQLNCQLPRTGQVHTAAAALLAAELTRHGLADLDPPRVTLETAVPRLLPGRPEGPGIRQSVTGGGVLGRELPGRPDRPRIAVTTGTCRDHYSVDAVAPVVALAKGVDAEFVLALRDLDTGPLGPLPDHVHSVGWFPHGALFPTCAAIVHSGDIGTVNSAIDFGLPQLIMCNPADQTTPLTADAVRASGIGLAAGPDALDEDGFGRLLTDPRLAEATAGVRAERAELPTTARIVPQLIGRI